MPTRSLRHLRPLGPGRVFLLAIAALFLVAACSEAEPSGAPESEVVGIVVSIDSPALGRVDSFELLTEDGDTLKFDTSEMAFRSEFPVSHLSEHQLLSDPIAVTYYEDGERFVVSKLDDGA